MINRHIYALGLVLDFFIDVLQQQCGRACSPGTDKAGQAVFGVEFVVNIAVLTVSGAFKQAPEGFHETAYHWNVLLTSLYLSGVYSNNIRL